jgi:hypothetical protein
MYRKDTGDIMTKLSLDEREREKITRPARLSFGGMSKQRRRNEAIGNIGLRRLIVLERNAEIMYVEATKEKADQIKKDKIGEGWHCVTTYFSDEKGIIALPHGMKEKYEAYMKNKK